jgi:hypothetical protein
MTEYTIAPGVPLLSVRGTSWSRPCGMDGVTILMEETDTGRTMLRNAAGEWSVVQPAPPTWEDAFRIAMTGGTEEAPS